jgi:hypothetical protein
MELVLDGVQSELSDNFGMILDRICLKEWTSTPRSVNSLSAAHSKDSRECNRCLFNSVNSSVRSANLVIISQSLARNSSTIFMTEPSSGIKMTTAASAPSDKK